MLENVILHCYVYLRRIRSNKTGEERPGFSNIQQHLSDAFVAHPTGFPNVYDFWIKPRKKQNQLKLISRLKKSKKEAKKINSFILTKTCCFLERKKRQK